MENQEIELIEKRVRNQLRIHWYWLKNRSYLEVAEFISAIIRKGEEKLNKDDTTG